MYAIDTSLSDSVQSYIVDKDQNLLKDFGKSNSDTFEKGIYVLGFVGKFILL